MQAQNVKKSGLQMVSNQLLIKDIPIKDIRHHHIRHQTFSFTLYFCTMKRNILLLGSFFITALLSAQTGKDEKEITGLLNKQTQSWNHGNLEEFMSGYWHSDSLMFVGKNGVTYGYANTLTNYKKDYSDSAKMGKLFFEILQVKRLSPVYYWVLGKWFLKRSIGDIGGHYTLLFKKINGKWMIIADHST